MQGRLTLQRRDSQTAVLDSLVYEYNTGTNRLRNTNAADGENYTYDKIGNLISDAEEGIDSIVWTPYGKVRKVEKTDNSSVSFRYDASGNRIAKIASGDTTLYVRDASGNVMGVYKNDTLIEQSIYGSSRLGLMTSSSKTGYRTLGGKKYELSNHLGNVLAVVSDNINLDQDSTWASVVNVTDYYPFGLAMEGRSLQDSAYRYGFNGKESDGEIKGTGNTYDFGARIYDSRVGRWVSVDPLADHPNQIGKSPYDAFWNNPIRYNDPDGKCPVCPFIAKGATGAAVDYFLQGAFNYAGGMDVGDAFSPSNIDKTDVLISGITGMNPFSVPGGKYGAAAAAAIGDVAINAGKAAVNGREYSAEQAGQDFLIGFAAQLGSEKVADLFGDRGIVFSADLSKSNAKSRSGHRNAGNKQLNEAMSSDPSFRNKMEEQLGNDVYERTSTSGKGRRNPRGFEWDHNTENQNQLDLRSKENHVKKTEKDPGRAGGYSKYWKDKK